MGMLTVYIKWIKVLEENEPDAMRSHEIKKKLETFFSWEEDHMSVAGLVRK